MNQNVDRDTGRTTQQMLSAPPSAVFVWPNGALHYPKDLARHLNRTDLRIVSPSWVADGRMLGCSTPIVVDHATRLGYSQQREVSIINAWKGFTEVQA